MKEYYIWNAADITTAQAALDFINSDSRIPLTGVNGKNKKLAVNKQKFARWSASITTFVNGTVGFPKLTTEIMDYMGVSETERNTFLTTFNPTILPFDDSWLPPKTN